MREFVKDGTVKAFALWNPADLGYLAAYAGAALASGMITGKEGEKFKAGKLGEFTVGKDGTVAARRARPRSTPPTSTSSTSDQSVAVAAGRHRPAAALHGGIRAPGLLHPAGRPDRLAEYRAPPRRGLAGDAGRAARRRLARLLALPARRRPAGRLPR